MLKRYILGNALISMPFWVTVIADKRVASEYVQMLEAFGVSISYSKSIVSRSGAGEFAKRFRVKSMTKDLSPVSVKFLLNWFHPYGLMGLADKYNLPFKVACRIGGIGYKGLSTLGWRAQRLFLMYERRRLLFDLWLGGGQPLNPYHYGILVESLRSEPLQQLVPIPIEAFAREEEYELCEYTMVREWLTLLRWKCEKVATGDVRLEEFFDAPVVETKWYATNSEPELVRFGKLWKLYERA